MEVSSSKGKTAITNYKTLEIFENQKTPTLSLVECKLETGRTHQIRVHMNFKGNSLVGDDKYKKYKEQLKSKNSLTILNEMESYLLDAINTSNSGYVTEDGDVERWIGGFNKKELSNKIKTAAKERRKNIEDKLNDNGRTKRTN